MIYLDNASTTKIDSQVLDEMLPYMTEYYGNAGTLYRLGRLSKQKIDVARQRVATLIGAEPEQIIFTSGGSEANNLVFEGLMEHLISCGKTHIVTSQIEHDSVLNSVQKVCNIKDQFYASFLPPNSDGCVTFDTVKQVLDKYSDVGLVSIMHTNNETGVQNPVKEIAHLCNERGVLFHTDCVQGIYSSEILVDDIGCDFLSISSHKIHGCKGVGALYVRNKSIMSPLICGGDEQEFGLRGGTENVAGIIGFGKACEILRNNRLGDVQIVDYLLRLLYKKIEEYLKQYELEGIMHVNGNTERQFSKTMNIRFDGVDGETLLLLLDAKGVCVSSGSACRSHESEPSKVLLAMGIDPEDARNSIRISLSKMNSESDVIEAANIIGSSVVMLHNTALKEET